MKETILGIHEKEAVEAMIAHVVSECSRVDVEAAFDDMLDECYSFDSVGGIFASMCPSRVLKECDPVAYRCGCNDWVDGERLIEIGSDYYRPDDVDEAQETFTDALSNEIADLEAELEGLEGEEEPDQIAIEAKQAEIKRKESELAACVAHAW